MSTNVDGTVHSTVVIFISITNFFTLKGATRQADRITKSQKTSAVTFIRIFSCISQMVASEYMDLGRFFNKVVFSMSTLARVCSKPGINYSNDLI